MTPVPALCRCGTVWLTATTDVFDAEGRRHGRAVCFEVAR